MALRELLAAFKIDVDAKELHEAQEGMEGFVGKLKQFGALAAEAFAVDQIKEFVVGQVEAATELERMAIKLGTTTDELQAMQLAANEAGVSSESLATGLRFLNRHIGEASKGSGEGAKVFKDLGISLKNADGSTRGATDILGEFADGIVKIPDAAKRTEVAMKLLGRGGVELVPLLLKGGDAFRDARMKMQELGGGLSGEFIDQSKQAEEAMADLKFATKGLEASAASTIIPLFTTLVDWITRGVKWFRELDKSTNLLSSAMIFFGTIAAAKAINSLYGIAKAFGLLSAEMLIPILIIGALFLIFNDLYTLMTGGESVIGDTLDELFGFGTAAQFVKDFNETLDATIDLMENLASIIKDSVMLALDEMWDTLKGIASALGYLTVGNVGKAWDSLKSGAVDAKTDFDKRTASLGQEAGGVADDFTLNKEGRRRKRLATDNAGKDFASQPAGFGVLSPEAQTNFVERGPERKNIYGSPYVPPTAAAGAGAGTKDDHSVVIHNNNKVDVHGVDTNDKRAVGDAVGPGIATATQRGMDRARTAHRKP
jgi:hypothetical protein